MREERREEPKEEEEEKPKMERRMRPTHDDKDEDDHESKGENGYYKNQYSDNYRMYKDYSIEDYFQYLQGTWVGGGVHENKVCKDDDEYYNHGYSYYDKEDYYRPATYDRFYTYEVLQFWWVDDVNLFAGKAFLGQAYLKKVYKAKTDQYGKLTMDQYGEPIYYPDYNYVVEEEAGFIMAYQDTETKKGWDVVKLVNHPHGYTIAVDADFEINYHKMKVSAEASYGDREYGIHMSPTAANKYYGYNYDIKAYEFYLELCKSHKYCSGDYC